MKLSKILSRQLIICDLQGSDRHAVYMEMLEHLNKHIGTKLNTNLLYNEIVEHEDLIGMPYECGFAIPHTRSAGINDYYVIIGIHREGIYLQEYDLTPSKVIIMSLISKSTSSLYLLALKAFVSYFSQQGVSDTAALVMSPGEFVRMIERDNIEIRHSLIAADVMLKELPTIDEKATLRQAIDLLAIEGGRSLAVTDEQERLIGSVSTQSILKKGIPDYIMMMDNVDFLQEFEPFDQIIREEDSLALKDFVNRSPETCQMDTPLIRLIVSLLRKKVPCFYVIDEQGHLMGQISSSEIIRNVLRG